MKRLQIVQHKQSKQHATRKRIIELSANSSSKATDEISRRLERD
jgi:hypothetical protein